MAKKKNSTVVKTKEKEIKKDNKTTNKNTKNNKEEIIEIKEDKEVKEVEPEELIEVTDVTQEKDTKLTFGKIIKEIIPYIIIFIIVIIIRTFFFTPILVNGPSMLPTLEGGEIMILNKRDSIDRFDIVIVNIGDDEIIKRVIAMPGETISCKKGVIYVNGRKQEEKYSQGITNSFDKITLKDDEYFVMGDNRPSSYDSRNFGPVSKDYIEGTSELIMYPFDKIGKVK